jgi:hypothetical protein
MAPEKRLPEIFIYFLWNQFSGAIWLFIFSILPVFNEPRIVKIIPFPD